MRAKYRGTKKNINLQTLVEGVATFSVASYTRGDKTYSTTIEVSTGVATCDCHRFKKRVLPAATLIQTVPTVGTSFVCKHIEDCGIEAAKLALLKVESIHIKPIRGIDYAPLTASLTSVRDSFRETVLTP